MTSKRAALVAKRAQRHQEGAARAMDGFVRTPAILAEEITTGHPEIGALPRGAVVLEPSAGDGAIVRAILDADPDAHVIAVEPNGPRADALDALAAEHPGRVTVHRCRFEDYAETHPGAQVDAVIMNPPFGDSVSDRLWMTHVAGAWGMLRPGAQLVSIVPPSYAHRSDRAHKEFREWATAQGARFVKLDGQPFKESGTGVSAGVLTLPRPMPARPDGLPSWLYAPAAGAPVAVDGYPHVTAAGALAMPVQEYSDFSDGHRPRVIRYVGTCHGCARPVWEHDDRGDAAVWEVCAVDAAECGQAGPSIALCLECFNDGERYAAALAAVAPYWTDAPADTDAAPVVYPLDLGAGCWATVSGVDSRGWDFTITGRVMEDPRPAAAGERVAVRLRTARGMDVELYALETSRVMLRDVPGDVVPASSGEPIGCSRPQPAAPAQVEPEPASNGHTIAGRAADGRMVVIAQVSHFDLTDSPEPVAPVEPAAELEPVDAAPFVSGWAQLALSV